MKDLDFAKKLNRLFDENNVTMLFVSHIHGYYRGVWGRTPYIMTGGAGAELAGSDPIVDALLILALVYLGINVMIIRWKQRYVFRR